MKLPLAVFLLVSYALSARMVFLDFDEMPLYSVFAMALIVTVFLGCLLYVASHMVKLLSSLKLCSPLCYRFLFGGWMSLVIGFWQPEQIFFDAMLMSLLSLYFVVFLVIGGGIIQFVVELLPIDRDSRYFSTRFPPRGLSDLVPGFGFVFIFSIMPFAAALMHQ